MVTRTFLLGLFLFLFEISIVCWIKFFFVTRRAAIGSTAIIIPVMILFLIFAFHFYHRLVHVKMTHHRHELNQLESLLISGKSSVENI